MYEQACIARKKKAQLKKKDSEKEKLPLSTRLSGISSAISQYQKEIRTFEKFIT